MQGVKHREWTSSQLPHRGMVATRRLGEGPSPEDSERSARNARAAVCEVAKEQQARQQQGGHWNTGTDSFIILQYTLAGE